MATLFSHAWPGVQGASWDAATWTHVITGSVTLDIDVNSGDATGRGRITGAASTDRSISYLDNPINTAPTGSRIRVRKSGGSAGQHVYLFARATGTFLQDDVTDGYRAWIDIGGNSVRIRRYIADASFDFPLVSGLSMSFDTDYWFYWEIEEDGVGGTNIRWRLWQDGTAEPGTWNQELNDTTAGRPSSGSVAVGGHSTAAGLYAYVDDYTVTDLSSATTTTVDVPATASLAVEATTTTLDVPATASLAGATTTTTLDTSATASLHSTSTLDVPADASLASSQTYWEISTGNMIIERHGAGNDSNGNAIVRDDLYTTTLESPSATTDWSPTYNGAEYKTSVRGLLMNIRAANAMFQDEGSNAYTIGAFDPAANTTAFIAELDTYKEHGVLALTISLQGGNPGTSGTNAYGETGGESGVHEISAFDASGYIKGLPATPTTIADYQNITSGTWADRFNQILSAMKTREMFCIVNLFYQRQDEYLTTPSALAARQNAVTQVVRFLVANNYRHVLIDVANEYDNGGFVLPFGPSSKTTTGSPTSSDNSAAGMILYTQEAYAAARTHFGLSASDWRAPVGLSSPTYGAWGGDIAIVADVAFPHHNEGFDGFYASSPLNGNVADDTAQFIIRWRNDWEAQVGSGNAGPIIMNEDDNSRFNYSSGSGSENGYFGSYNLGIEEHAMNDCLAQNASWGLMHRWLQQYTGQPEAGYDTQSPDYWKWGEGASATVNGTDSEIYLSAILDLYGTATLSGATTETVNVPATASLQSTTTLDVSATASLAATTTATVNVPATASLAGDTTEETLNVSATASLENEAISTTINVSATASLYNPDDDLQIVSITGSDDSLISIEGSANVAKETAITVNLGSDTIIEVTIDGSGSISGQTFKGKIAKRRDPSTVVLSGTPVVHNADSRVVRWTIADTDLVPGSGNVPSATSNDYEFDVWRDDGGSDIPLAHGRVTLQRLPSST